MKKKRSQLLLAGLAITTIAGAMPTFNAVADNLDWIYDQNQILIANSMNIEGGSLNGIVNLIRIENLGISSLCFFTYNEDFATQSYVEANLPAFRDNPAWVKDIVCYDQSAGEYDTMLLDLDFSKTDIFSSNRNGIMYYAMNVKWWDLNEQHWVWGKFDYRRCAYNPETNNLDGTCGTVNDSNPPELVRNGGNLTPYVSWPDEWSQVMTTRLDEVALKIEAWNGDNDEKESIEAKLVNLGKTTGDAVNADDLDTKIEELTRKLEKKVNDLAEVEEEKPKEPDLENKDDKEGEDDKELIPTAPTDNEEIKSPSGESNATSGNSSMDGFINTSEAVPEPSDDVEKHPDEANNSTVFEVIANNSSINYQPAAVAAVDNSDEVQKTDEAREEVMRDLDSTDIEIPDLREDEVVEQVHFWSFWWIIAMILAFGGAIWWCKRAFLGINHKRK